MTTNVHAGLDACDRCLALSELTVTLAKVPRLNEETARHVAPEPVELLAAVDGMRPERADGLRPRLRGWSAERLRAACSERGLRAICGCSSAFPAAALQLADPPPVLFVRGDAALLGHCDRNAIAMVGTRRPTRVGRDAADRIAAGVARSGAVVVSGMALGIDAASHEGALSVGGVTIAVLAGGADRATPPSHRRLYDQILERGAVVSELPPGVQPFKWSFPARNRIIAALARATVVVEAPLRSGALITVEQAQDLGRDVYAVPGSLANESSEGTNRMLCDGAMAVVDGAALVLHQGMDVAVPIAGPREGPPGEVHGVLGRGPLSLDEIARRATSLAPGEVELALLDLELAGWVARRPDGRYRVVDRWVP